MGGAVRVERREHPHEPEPEQFPDERALEDRGASKDAARIRGFTGRLHGRRGYHTGPTGAGRCASTDTFGSSTTSSPRHNRVFLVRNGGGGILVGGRAATREVYMA